MSSGSNSRSPSGGSGGGTAGGSALAASDSGDMDSDRPQGLGGGSAGLGGGTWVPLRRFLGKKTNINGAGWCRMVPPVMFVGL